jgi:hypothetical protein
MAGDLDVALANLAAAIDEVASLDLHELGSAGLEAAVVSLHELGVRLDAAEGRVLDRWKLWGGWRASGAKTAAAWHSSTLRIPIQASREKLRHARIARGHPAIAEAWASAEIDRGHLTTLAGACNPRTRFWFERDHKLLLDHARTMGFVDFKRVVDTWELCADPDGAEQGAEEGRAARELHLSELLDGSWRLTATLDPISGQIVKNTIDELERELFDAEWAARKQELGRVPLVSELPNTPAQRRHDALVEGCIRARMAPVGGRRPRPLFNVLVGYETFAGPLCELYNRTVVTPGSLLRWLDQAEIERVVYDGPSRIIDLGERRLFTGALNRAIKVRDRTCFHPTCDEPPQRPNIDHIQEASKGGPTTQENGRLGCDFHNRWRNTHPDSDPDPP